jgi:hypothetical protein
MGVKYIVQFKSPDGVAWQCNIATASYTAVPIAVRGVSEQAVEIDYEGDTVDDPFDPFKKSTMTINFYNQGQVDMDELMRAGDKDFTVKFFRNGQLRWAGFLKPEDIQWNFLTPPQQGNISFLCGLALLDDIPYTHTDLPGTTGTNSRCAMNYIRNILFQAANLGITLPIRWTNQLQCTAFSDDFFTGGVQWSPFNEGFYTYQQGVTGDAQGPAQKCGYILRGFLKATQSRIYQCNGKWVIRRVNDVIAGSIAYKEIAGTLGVMSVQSGIQNLSKRIGRSGYPFINENAVMTVVPGLKSFKSTYTANIRSNIIPNGNYDILKSDLTVADVLAGSIILYWGSYADLLVNPEASLDGRSGFCAQLTNVTGDEYFTMVSTGGEEGKNGLPIDAYTLIPVINFSFTFSPGIGFAPVDGDDLIIWDSQPLQFKMILNQGAATYYLNEFGTWSAVEAWIPIVIDGLKILDIAQVAFDKFQGIKIPQPAAEPIAGDTCDLQLIFRVKSGQTYSLDNMSVTIDNGNDVYEVFDDSSKNTATDEAELDISSSFGGYMLSNFMSSPFKSGQECGFNDGLLYSGTLTAVNSQAIMRFRYKSSQVLNTDVYVAGRDWSFDEIYSVDTLLGKKFLPLNAKYNVEKGTVSIVAMEARNDNITLRESFYSSNDNPSTSN